MATHKQEAPDRVALQIVGAELNVAVRTLLCQRSYGRNKEAEGGDRAGIEGEAAENRAHRSPRGGASEGVDKDPESTKNVKALKAALDNMRATIREHEDTVTELKRDKESLLDQVASLDALSLENAQATSKVAALESQADELRVKLSQAKAGGLLTMKLMDTLKSAQAELRSRHAQVAQRCAELESVVEDSAEAIRRGDGLLRTQRLNLDAQSRQLRRQEKDLAALREERDSQLARADRSAMELAQVTRRETTAQARTVDAQKEADERKRESAELREMFARQRDIMRKNQEVLVAQEKALDDARSEIVSTSLSAERQSTRQHHALSESTAESRRFISARDAALQEVQKLRLERDDFRDQLNKSRHRPEKTSSVTTRLSPEARFLDTDPQPRANASNDDVNGHHDGFSISSPAPVRASASPPQPPNPAGKPAAQAIEVRHRRPSMWVPDEGAGGVDRPRHDEGDMCGRGDPHEARDRRTSSEVTTGVLGVSGQRGEASVLRPERALVASGDTESHKTFAPGDSGAPSLAAGSRTPGEASLDRSSDTAHQGVGGAEEAITASDADSRSKRKTYTSRSDEQGVASSPGVVIADFKRSRGSQSLSPGASIVGVSYTSALQNGPRRVESTPALSGSCLYCGDTPYGLMIKCRGCCGQCHSSCVPEGRKIGSGLRAVFRCSTCAIDEQDD